MSKTTRVTRGPALTGQLEIALGNVGDNCDHLTVVVQHLARAGRHFASGNRELTMLRDELDRAYRAGSLGYRQLVTAIDGRDPGDERGTPPREREARRRALAGAVA